MFCDEPFSIASTSQRTDVRRTEYSRSHIHMKKIFAIFTVALGAIVATLPVEAQTCSGTTSCTVNLTASLAIPSLVALSLGAATQNLTPPAQADLVTGYVQEAGPSITVKANKAWTLSLSTTTATNWTYTGTASGVKPIGDLTYSKTAGGTYAAITGTAVQFDSGAKTNSGTSTIFFRTLYPNDYSDPRVAPGTYTLAAVFTLAAP